MEPKQPTFNTVQDWPLLKKTQHSPLLQTPPTTDGLKPEDSKELRNWLNPSLTTSHSLTASHLVSKTPAKSPPKNIPTPPPFFPPQSHTQSQAQPSPAQILPQMAVAQMPAALMPVLPSLIRLIQEISSELSKTPQSLLALNPSRREALVHHLNRLAGLPQSTEPYDIALKNWIGGAQSPAQTEALKVFREEVALICIGQAILLKAWSDKGIRKWNEVDIKHLNWALSNALKPQLPLNREGCQITRPNLYSWYNPSVSIQHEIWNLLQSWNLQSEGPDLLSSALSLCRKPPKECGEAKSYDSRFFSQLWESMSTFGLDPFQEPQGPIARKRVAFAPTLRDGTLVRTAPRQLQWAALEKDPFKLIAAELSYLWWGPTAPPLWAVGSGLEVHTREQLAMEWNSAKPSLHVKIAELEACDLAVVLEEKSVRTHQKTTDALRLRTHLESLPYFKKLRASETSLGCLQTCVAVSKLRPGGLLWWAREEPLTSREGGEALRFLMDRARLICEWDLSAVTHSLPTGQMLFPRYLYLFERDAEVERRRSHRPLTLRVSGSVRSHVEIPLLLGDLFSNVHEASHARGQWEFIRHRSPTAQQEWPDHWPGPAAQDQVHRLEKLREDSIPLGQIATIRMLPTAGSVHERNIFDLGEKARSLSFAIGSLLRSDQRTLCSFDPWNTEERGGPKPEPAFLVAFADDAWVAPIKAYLQSTVIRDWLDLYAERKQQRWVLKESTIKFLPIPKAIVERLRQPGATVPASARPLVRDIASAPQAVRQALQPIKAGSGDLDFSDARESLAYIFIEAARTLESLFNSQRSLLSLVHEDGTLSWGPFMSVLPKSESIPFPRHPEVRLVGTLAPHLPIDKVQRVHQPHPGVMLSTESGMNLQIRVDDHFLGEVLWDQVRNLKHSTWSEVAQNVFLPRDPEMTRATASDILSSYQREKTRLQELKLLIEESHSI